MRAKRNNKFTKAPQDFVDTKIVGIDWCRGKTSPRGPSPRARRRAATAEHQQVSASRNTLDDRRRGARGGNRPADDEVSAAGQRLRGGRILTFLAGESLLLAGNAAGLQASVPSYVGGISLWAAALVMVSAPKTFALWMRLTAVVAAVLLS
jgi:hypothetical protein